jgi:hypothetical protein
LGGAFMTFSANLSHLDSCSTEPQPSLGWQPSPTLEELRHYPRVSIEIPVAFRNSSGQHCAARLCNLSPEGLQVRCNLVTAQMIYPAGGKLNPDNQPILQATAVLPLAGGGQETLSAGVRLLYFAVDEVHPHCILGLQFLSLRPKARRIVDTFFAEQLRNF